MTNVIIVGSGGHARSVIDAAMLKGKLTINGVIDVDFEDGRKEEIFGFPILGGLEFLEKVDPKSTAVFLAVGDNKARKKLSLVIESYGFDSVNIFHPKAYVSKQASVGKGNFIGAFANVGPGVKIGNYSLVNTLVNLEHEVSVGNFCQFAPGAIICGRTEVSDNVFVGAGAVVVDKMSIPDSVVVGAGAVLTNKPLEKCSTYVGVPARKL